MTRAHVSRLRFHSIQKMITTVCCQNNARGIYAESQTSSIDDVITAFLAQVCAVSSLAANEKRILSVWPEGYHE